MSTGIVIISSECTNCKRFLDALRSIKNHGIQPVDYSVLTPMQRVGINAVPTLILEGGKRLVGTDCFKWLHDKSANVEPDGFDGFDSCADGLTFSSVNDDVGYSSHGYQYAPL
ncbi:hypothetical protein NY2A_B273L [Paramecium bursaria Chlorella virus NY2A]|uniref:Uncharacterized protein B273L n=1 Tax=Paramecium bursaria Chlorella virus NY2A TaxID=46021 RepID=A7IWE8_PBCVN|nr:hypothetical protein NY2A_B273L [Paramecium bursaria Chlorella virus NY2A]ABT14672.1 hypothetical protein NY2A_B273L [Paramecium bursaria Chlorella virus NY2A]